MGRMRSAKLPCEERPRRRTTPLRLPPRRRPQIPGRDGPSAHMAARPRTTYHQRGPDSLIASTYAPQLSTSRTTTNATAQAQLMDMDDDFTFAIAAAAAATPPEGVAGEEPLPAAAGCLLAGAAATMSPPLWPFSSSPETARRQTSSTAAPAVEQASPLERTIHLAAASWLRAGADADEEWERERAAAASREERMDLLWEDFNAKEHLRRVRSSAAAAAHRRGTSGDGDSPSQPSDAESEGSTSASASGCAPAMMRASSRAGGQLYGSSRRSGRTAGWALLLRLFRRLLAADKTPPSQPRRYGINVP